ncbi:MAG TPA: DUF4382 domain-containing protein [Gemmatimonadales bacterium]|nr:DUF4382 domain-containing protein [Gemmatimonadales bacterium]
MRRHKGLTGLLAVTAAAALAAGCSSTGNPLTGTNGSQLAPVVVTLHAASPTTSGATSGAPIMADPGMGGWGGEHFWWHGMSLTPSSLKVVVTAVSFLPTSADTIAADSGSAADSAQADTNAANDSTDADSAESADSSKADSSSADSAESEHESNEGDRWDHAGWITVQLAEPDTIDLLALPVDSSKAIVIATDSIPAGTYGRVRLEVSGGSVTFDSTVTVRHGITFQADSAYPLTIPSGAQSGIKTNVSFTVSADSTGTPAPIQLIFDPTNTFTHLTVTGNGKILLAPVFRCEGPHD